MTLSLLMIGTTELLLIAGIALLLFGGKKLPELMRGMGRGVKSFKEGLNEIDHSIETDKNEEKEGEAVKAATNSDDTDKPDNGSAGQDSAITRKQSETFENGQK